MNAASPTSKQLAAYVLGDLAGVEALRIEEFIRTTPEAAAQVAQMRVMIQTMQSDDTVAPSAFIIERVVAELASLGRVPTPDAATPSFTELARNLIAALVFDSWAQPALAGFRGAARGRQLSYEMESVTIDMQITPDRADGTWRVQGQVAADETVANLGISLADAATGRAIQSTHTDGHGRFRLGASTGTYELRIHMNRGTAIVPDLNMR